MDVVQTQLELKIPRMDCLCILPNFVDHERRAMSTVTVLIQLGLVQVAGLKQRGLEKVV